MRRPHAALRPALLATAALALGTVALPEAAPAQGLRGPLLPQEREQRQQRPPPALPGLQGRRSAPVIPADPSAGALAPNEALFDAINRGDLPAAREAIGRGASIDSRNVLGLTPIDSAVDQGRTEIMFYLLSVRGSARSGSGPPEEEAAAARRRPQTAAERRAAAAAAARAAAAEEGRETKPAGPARVAQPVPRTARLWAGDGGAPIPAVGFLGFDAGRPGGGGPVGPRGGAGQRGRG